MPLNILQSDDACHACVKFYAKKHDFKKGDKFDIQCRGISKQYVSDTATALLDSTISPEVVLDPVRWASEVLDWHCLDPDGDVWARKDPEEYVRHMAEYPGRKSKYHRPYQATMLRCTSKYKVFRIGRQCIEKDEYIYTASGIIKSSEVKDRQQSLGGKCSGVHSFEDDLVKITFHNGTSLKVNAEHPFYTRKGWIQAKDLTLQDWVEFLNYKESDQAKGIDPKLAKLLGYLMSDGYFGKGQSPKFTNNNPAFLLDVFQLTNELFSLNCNIRPKNNGYDLYLTDGNKKTINPINNLLKDLNVWDGDSFGKVQNLDIQSTKHFIAGYFNGDGYLWSHKRPKRKGFRSEIGFAIGISERKAYEFQFMLWKLGISSVVKKEWMKKSTCHFYRVVVSKTIDQHALLSFLDQTKYPEKFQLHDQHLIGQVRHPGIVYREDRQEVKIKKIEDIGRGTVVGWETETHEIISYNGMRTHNTGKTECLVISILFNMFTNSNYKIVLITPFQSQIDLIFKRIETLVQGNPTLTNSIKRSVKAPQYTVTLHNGSEIIGFTAGTKSGNGAGSARGQHANMLVFDEGDYLDRSDLDAAMAIITNSPDATVWMSSTPTGRREKFYEICHDREWKEFHYPSHVNPNWTEQLDRLFKKNLTTIGYKHEILAEFGEQEEGVFQASYVDKAMAEYSYAACTPSSGWLYSIGVDWNSPKIGTTIYVTGFNPASNRFMLVEHMTIQREGWTQTAACEKIVELNRKWRPFAIYVDQGYGSVQIEILRKYGFDARIDPEKGPSHIDSRLPKVVKAFDFGSSIEIRDPFTKELRKKPAKGFLVENAVRRFEANDLMIAKEDAQLKRELLGYIVKNVTVTGQVVYTTLDDTIGDHNLDAMMLSLVAFTLEKSALGKPILNEKVQFTSIENRNSNQIADKDLTPIKTQGDKEKQEQQQALRPADRSELKGTASNNKKIWNWPGFMRDEPKPINNGGYRGRSQSTTIFKRPHTGPSKRSSF